MPTLLEGKNVRIKKDDTDVSMIGKFSFKSEIDVNDYEVYGVDYKLKTVGTDSWSGNFSGYLAPTDTQQNALIAAYQAKTPLTDVKFYLSTTKYIQPDAATVSGSCIYITGLSIDNERPGAVEVGFDFEGSGAWSIV